MAFDPSKMLEKFSPDPKKSGTTLFVLNVFSMILAGLCNTFSAASDKNTSSEDKKFLIPAGFATSVANIGTYCAMTLKMISGLQKGADKSVNKMKADGVFNKNALDFVNKSIDKAQGGFLGTGLFKKSKEYVSDMKSTLLKDGELTTEGKLLYENSLKDGAGVLGAFAGAVICCGVLTPIIRDVSAYIVQKHMERKNPALKDKPYRPYFDPTHLKVSHKYNSNTPKQPLTMTNYMAFTNGSMKV